MNEYITARRSDDAVISVCQRNKPRDIIITGLNKTAENLLLYEESDLLNKPLFTILNQSVVESINNYLEYDSEGPDLFDVLSRVRKFLLIDKNRIYHEVKQKVFRTTSNQNMINFEILIRDISLSSKLRAFRDSVLPGNKYNIDAKLGIIDEQSTKQEVQIVLDFVNRNKIDSILSVVTFDHLNSSEIDSERLKVIVDVICENVRIDDIVGYVGSNRIAFILMGCKLEYANSVVYRLHKAISNGLTIANLGTVSIGYLSLINEKSVLQSLEKIDLALANVQKNGGNSVVLAKELDRHIGDFSYFN